MAKHRLSEISPDNPSAKSRRLRNRNAHIESARADVEIRSGRLPFDIQLANCPGPPRLVDIEAQNMIQEVITRRDLRKNLLDVGPLFSSAASRAECSLFFVLVSHRRES